MSCSPLNVVKSAAVFSQIEGLYWFPLFIPSLPRSSNIAFLSFLLSILKFGQHFPLVAGRVWSVGIQTCLLL